MSNDLLDGKIELNNLQEIKKWCEQLNCCEEDLIDAVLKVGSSAKMVNVFLELNRKKNNEK